MECFKGLFLDFNSRNSYCVIRSKKLFEVIDISNIEWNRITTIIGVVLIILVLVLTNNNIKTWYKHKFSKDVILTGHNKINQVIHADLFSFQASLVLNADGKIIGANKKAQTMFGWHENELMGSTIDKIIVSVEKFEEHKKQYSGSMYKVQMERQNIVSLTDEIAEVELEAVTKIHEKKILRVMTGKWTDDVDIYFTVTMIDITHRKKNEETLKVVEKEINYMRHLFHEGEKVGHVGFWKMDTKTGKLQYSSNFANLFAIKGAEVYVEQLIKRVHTDDRVMVAETMRRAKENKTGYDMEYRLMGLDGYINTIHSTASAVKNGRGELTDFIGMARLIKKEKPEWI